MVLLGRSSTVDSKKLEQRCRMAFMPIFLLSLVLGGRTVMLQLSGFYCRPERAVKKLLPRSPSWSMIFESTIICSL